MSCKQSGFSLVSAIFLLVALTVLGAGMLAFSNAQHQASAMDVLGGRAYQAARAGVEWSAYQILKNGGGAFTSGCQAGPVSEVIPAGTLAAPLDVFSVTINCSSVTHTDITPATAETTREVKPVHVYSITSTATTGVPNEISYVERQISVSIAQ